MSRKRKNDKPVDPSLPQIPPELLSQLVSGPMTAFLSCLNIASSPCAGIGRYLEFYNRRGPHFKLERRTPDQVYFNLPLPLPWAA
jgi:hypothetical protein